MSLTDREKETLRLLLVGHDAKSIAGELGISVHTVNERLRDARRKLGVSSSREAARRLASLDANDPQFLAAKDFGVAPMAVIAKGDARPNRGLGAGQPLAWLGGGMILMSLLVAAIAISSLIHAGGGVAQPASPGLQPIAVSPNAPQSAAALSARSWVALLDGARWADSWTATGALFKSQITQAQWATTVTGVRAPLGAAYSRMLQTETKTDALPGAPKGEYDVIQFQTNFAQKRDAVETVILTREGSVWKVNGYFIR
ncbi:DNA-binding CsgD family transcriptional regulator [Sphingomonas vulcanisoli]|uniref:DNA-binding CsgD family transcriptional regulator n=1 Tax=Sphingomonas vulcanisoli TaxID=1658060 RepID=A0ABX0TQW2_9SPHN|nr:DUF4019 domain-containing protein [Sphingomonas vulcanisoli]NIJ07821.1 DNA-binding CsgD family transcriptional regulator [Sphingomonas vulcanisoli]